MYEQIKSIRLIVYFYGKILVSLLLTTLQTQQAFLPTLHILIKGTFMQRLAGLQSNAYSHPWSLIVLDLLFYTTEYCAPV